MVLAAAQVPHLVETMLKDESNQVLVIVLFLLLNVLILRMVILVVAILLLGLPSVVDLVKR